MSKEPTDSNSNVPETGNRQSIGNRLPPGQQLVAAGKWPIVGERMPAESNYPPTLTISPLAGDSFDLSLDDLKSFKQTKMVIDIHCVTRWSKLDVEFDGVLLSDLLAAVGVSQDANFVSFVSLSSRKHSSSLALPTALEQQTLIAHTVDGSPLPEIHGGPIRNLVPGRYFYKSVKWLNELKMLDADSPGFWESDVGYHNLADPWKEQRYMAPNVDRRTAAELIRTRDFSARDLRSIDVSNLDLTGLKAKSSQLRDANFRSTNLSGSDFTQANLSNAHFQSANLFDCCFIDADLEGANLSGADLRGADLTGCSLIGSSFCEFDADGEVVLPAKVNEATVLPTELPGGLVPAQREFLLRITGQV